MHAIRRPVIVGDQRQEDDSPEAFSPGFIGAVNRAVC